MRTKASNSFSVKLIYGVYFYPISAKVCQNNLDLKDDSMLLLLFFLAYAFLFRRRVALSYSVCNVNIGRNT